MATGRKVRIVTYGCQMNSCDSEQLAFQLARLGYELTERQEEADLVILNSCSVRAKPVRKLLSQLGRLRQLKKRRPEMLLAVAGCVAQQEGDRLLAQEPALDIVLGPDHIGEICDLVESARRSGRQVVAVDFKEPGQAFGDELPPARQRAVSAFLTVMKGCNQFCSYCIVPYTRGREQSKPPDRVLAEASGMIEGGARELYLLGQNVNRYGKDNTALPSFTELLRRIDALPGLARLRFITSHPSDCPEELVRAFSELDRLGPYFHLPLQSGSDRILKAMNRGYDLAHYRRLIERLRRVRPEIHLSTDLIVGFPGEQEEDFVATLDAARQIGWGSAFSFKYSPRPGTAAAMQTDDVAPAIKQERFQRLQEVLEASQQAALAAHVGQIVTVLVEGISKWTGEGGTGGTIQLTGRCETNYIVNFRGEVGKAGMAPGELVRLRIVECRAHTLIGELPEEEEKRWPSR